MEESDTTRSDRKSYLTTFMENDLIKPWKQLQLPPKRVSVPKRVANFVTCTNEEPTTVEHQVGTSPSTSVKTKGCCQFCQKELSAFKETIMDTVSEVKKQVRKLKRTSSSGVVQPALELTQLEKEWRKLISNSTSDAAAFY